MNSFILILTVFTMTNINEPMMVASITSVSGFQDKAACESAGRGQKILVRNQRQTMIAACEPSSLPNQ